MFLSRVIHVVVEVKRLGWKMKLNKSRRQKGEKVQLGKKEKKYNFRQQAKDVRLYSDLQSGSKRPVDSCGF